VEEGKYYPQFQECYAILMTRDSTPKIQLAMAMTPQKPRPRDHHDPQRRTAKARHLAAQVHLDAQTKSTAREGGRAPPTLPEPSFARTAPRPCTPYQSPLQTLTSCAPSPVLSRPRFVERTSVVPSCASSPVLSRPRFLERTSVVPSGGLFCIANWCGRAGRSYGQV
jgi:hypothetical protein